MNARREAFKVISYSLIRMMLIIHEEKVTYGMGYRLSNSGAKFGIFSTNISVYCDDEGRTFVLA